MARTAKVCSPVPTRIFCGELHFLKRLPSSEHSKVEPFAAGGELEARAYGERVLFGGCLVIVVSRAAPARRLIVTDFEVIPPALVAVQVSVVPAAGVSLAIVTGSQPLVVAGDCVSATRPGDLHVPV